MRNLRDCFDAKQNNFDLLRLVCSSAVLFSHSYYLAAGDRYEPLSYWLGTSETGGSVAVLVFFFISGFLLFRSAERSSLPQFAIARALRIVPALAFVSLLQLMILGPVFTTLSIVEYFRAGALSHLLNAFVFPISLTLPGVFEELPVPAVNGSIWTLPTEVFFYGVLVVLLAIGLVNKATALGGWIFLVSSFAVLNYLGYDWTTLGPKIVQGVNVFPAAKWGMFFFAGAAAWSVRDRLPISPLLALIFATAIVALPSGIVRSAFFYLGLPYITLFLAVWKPVKIPVLDKVGDISYGVYLYAFPIQQTIVHLHGVGIHPMLLSALAFPATIIFAYLSYRFIERPMLMLKRREAPKVHSESA